MSVVRLTLEEEEVIQIGRALGYCAGRYEWASSLAIKIAAQLAQIPSEEEWVLITTLTRSK